MRRNSNIGITSAITYGAETKIVSPATLARLSDEMAYETANMLAKIRNRTYFATPKKQNTEKYHSKT